MKTEFRKKIESIKGSNEVASFYVKQSINEFFNERKIWYNKIESHNGNLTNAVSSDIDYIRNVISGKFGTTLGINFEEIKHRVVRKIRNSTQRKSIRKSGKYRKGM